MAAKKNQSKPVASAAPPPGKPAAPGSETGVSAAPAEASNRAFYANLGLGALWLYVAALWTLAISQTFDLGWFGP